MAGLEITKATADLRMGSVVVTLRETFEDIQTLKGWLDGKSDSELTSMGWTAGEVATMKSAFTDLDDLRRVAYAQATQGAVRNFFAFAQNLTGLS